MRFVDKLALTSAAATLVAALFALQPPDAAAQTGSSAAQIGPRPFYLVDTKKPGPAKERLKACGPDRRIALEPASPAEPKPSRRGERRPV